MACCLIVNTCWICNECCCVHIIHIILIVHRMVTSSLECSVLAERWRNCWMFTVLLFNTPPPTPPPHTHTLKYQTSVLIAKVYSNDLQWFKTLNARMFKIYHFHQQKLEGKLFSSESHKSEEKGDSVFVLNFFLSVEEFLKCGEKSKFTLTVSRMF